MKIIYNLFIFLYNCAIHIASLFNEKAKLWVKGRNNIFEKIKSEMRNPKSEILWFHCASLGEFEQARPLIEATRKQSANTEGVPGGKEQQTTILITFFSPSGYEIRKNYSEADYIFYLPIDTVTNARCFISLIKPTKVFFVKYEFWFNYLNELKDKNIPTYLVSGIFRENHYFFKGYGSWARKQLKCFTHFFLQDEKSKELLNSIGYTNATVCGDTRFDRVNDIALNVKSFPLIEQFADNKNVIIAGSTWSEDEEIIADYKVDAEDYKLVIAPHEIDEAHINSLCLLFSDFSILLYSEATSENVKGSEVLIIDNIGMLSSIYQYGRIAYIGGGFGKGIHNILEAATFGLPVIFGPDYHKFNEAKELIRTGGAFSIKNKKEFEQTIQLLNNKMVHQTASLIARNYVQSNAGATRKILMTLSGKYSA